MQRVKPGEARAYHHHIDGPGHTADGTG
jgi:hypothetical protein